MGTARSEMPAAVLEDRIYVLGGLGDGVSSVVERYDPMTDRWDEVAPLPEARHHLMAVASGDRLYAMGGFDATGFNPVNTAHVYHPDRDEWARIADLPMPVGAGAAAALEGMVFVVGGVPGGSVLLRYDPEADDWTELASLTRPREHLAAAALQARLYVLGGRWGEEMLSTVEVFDPVTGSWSEGPSMMEARSGFGAGAVNGMLVVAGGEVFGPTRTLDGVEVLADDAWSEADPLPVPLHGVPLAVVDGTVYVLGGSGWAGRIDNSGRVWAWRP